MFNLVRALYRKQGNSQLIDTGLIITLNKWLSFDKENLAILKQFLQYLFWIDPIHYFYLLYFKLPYKWECFIDKVDAEKLEEPEDELLDKIQYIMGWSKRELNYNVPLLNIILKDRKHWNKEFGICSKSKNTKTSKKL